MRRSAIALLACVAGLAGLAGLAGGTASAATAPVSVPLTCTFTADVALSPGIGLLTTSGTAGSDTTNAKFVCTGSLNGVNVTGGEGVMTGHYKGNCLAGSGSGNLTAEMHTDTGLTFPVVSTWQQTWSGFAPTWASVMSFVAPGVATAHNAGAMTALHGNCLLGHVTQVRITAAGISLH